MKTRFFLLTIAIGLCHFASCAQSQCDALLDAARKYKNKGEYEKAIENYDRLEKKCPDYFTETVRGERNNCKKKLNNQNKSVPQKPSGGSGGTSGLGAVSGQDSGIGGEIGYGTSSRKFVRPINTSVSEEGLVYVEVHVMADGTVSEARIMNDSRHQTTINNHNIQQQCLQEAKRAIYESGKEELRIIVMSGQSNSFSEKTSDQTVTSNQQSFSQTISTPQSVEDQLKTVKVSFEPGKATPVFENERLLIKYLQGKDSLCLKIEIPWCRNQYSMKLIEKRIQNIIDYFVAVGIEEKRISSSIILVDVEDDYHFFVDYQNSEKDKDPRISDHITLINVDEGYRACDSAWLKTEELLRVGDDFVHPLSDVLSKSKILFDFGKESPIIYDYHDNIVRTVEILNQYNKLKLVVEGYASDAANENEQRDLAQKRVTNVRKIFIQMGVNPGQIETATYSLIDPQTGQKILNSNKEECRAAIFRIEKRLYFEISFDHDSDIPKIYENNKDVDEFVAALNENPNLILIVEGYTGGLGSEQHNRDLGMRRSSRVRDIFIKKGVSPDRIETASYTVNDPQNQNNANQAAFDGAICRIIKR